MIVLNKTQTLVDIFSTQKHLTLHSFPVLGFATVLRFFLVRTELEICNYFRDFQTFNRHTDLFKKQN